MKLKNIYNKCIDRDSVFLITLYKYVLYKICFKKTIVCHHAAIIKNVNNIVSNHVLEIGMGKIGFSDKHDRTLLNLNGEMIFEGPYSIGRGCRIDVAKGAKIKIGEGGFINVNSTFIIMHGLTIGNNCAISWDCQFLDEDFHKINYIGKKEKSNEIFIGDNVWIGCGVKIYKGSIIPDGSVIASDSIVRGVFFDKNTLIAGNPARSIKENVNWK